MERNHDRSSTAGTSRRQTWMAVLLLILAAFFLYTQVRNWFAGVYDKGAVPRAVTPRGDLAEDEKGTLELFKATSPSVVRSVSK